MTPADETPLDPDFIPEPTRRIASVETLRVVSDPTRMRLMETMVQRQDPPWSVRELAAELQVPQTRLYHHIEQLRSHDIIRPVERRVVSGIIETRYRISAFSFQLDRRLFEGGEDERRTILHDTLVAVFDTARDEIETAMRGGALKPPGSPRDEPLLVVRSVARLTPDRAEEYRRRLKELEDEFSDPDGDQGGGRAWGVVLALYPLPQAPAPVSPTPDTE